MIVNQEKKRTENIQGLDKSLEKLENERESNFEYFRTSLKNSLIDVAFILEPEVIVLIN